MKKLWSFAFLVIAVLIFTATAEPCSISASETLKITDFEENDRNFSRGGSKFHHGKLYFDEGFKDLENAGLSLHLLRNFWFEKNPIEKYSFEWHQDLPHLDHVLHDIEFKGNRPFWSLFRMGKKFRFYCKKPGPQIPTGQAPIPGTVLLLASGIISLAIIEKRRFRKTS